MKCNNKIAVFMTVLLLSMGVVLAYNSIFGNPDVFGHVSSEVEGAWDVPPLDPNVVYTLNSVGIGIVPLSSSELTVAGNIKISGPSNGLIFSDGTTLSAVSGPYYCPPRQMGLNIRDDDDENLFHNGCEYVEKKNGITEIKIKDMVLCADNYGTCGPIVGDVAGGPNEVLFGSELCLILGYDGYSSMNVKAHSRGTPAGYISSFNFKKGSNFDADYLKFVSDAVLFHEHDIKDITCQLFDS